MGHGISRAPRAGEELPVGMQLRSRSPARQLLGFVRQLGPVSSIVPVDSYPHFFDTSGLGCPGGKSSYFQQRSWILASRRQPGAAPWKQPHGSSPTSWLPPSQPEHPSSALPPGCLWLVPQLHGLFPVYSLRTHGIRLGWAKGAFLVPLFTFVSVAS